MESMAERKAYLRTLTEEEKIAYNRYRQKINAKKFNDKPENKKKYNEMRKNHIKYQRELAPEHFQEQNVKDLKNFREREKKKKALLVITNAIRAKKAKEELKRLKEVKEKISGLESLLNNLRKELKK